MKDLVWLVPLFPLLGAALNGLGTFLPRWGKKTASAVGLAGAGLAMICGWAAIWPWLVGRAHGPHLVTLWQWILGGDWYLSDGGLAAFTVDLSFLLDPLSALMTSFVTLVGFLIHVYSVGYMHGEPRGAYARYFSYLNLFMFSMLTLVLGGNFLVTFVGWEGVGLCSYLLIGFYYDKKFAADAGKKAFVTNRIGDFGFVLAMLLVFTTFGTLDYLDVFSRAAANPGILASQVSFGLWEGGELWSVTLAAAIGLLLFLGACGKSAQLPLYVWLPDAMAGPTPVSALIHAATMVTAGVFMVVRSNVVFRISANLWEAGAAQGGWGVVHRFFHDASYTVAVVGVLTAFFAATIGLAQNDIKKVLAYSTVSQLGYMFLGCGVGAFVWGIFHVLTHAFFKACLFLGSGSVIHAMGGEQDIQKMGGLKKYLPVTYWTMLVSTWAIAGFPWASGFFSKDPILGAAWFARHPGLFGLGLVTAGMTAFYMYRMMNLTFRGEFRGTEEQAHHLHESPPSMIWPLRILGAPYVFTHVAPLIERLLHPVFLTIHSGIPLEEAHHPSLGEELPLMLLSVVMALLGWFVARWLYIQRDLAQPHPVASRFPRLHAWCFAKWKVDELYEATVIGPTKKLGKFLWDFDARVVDGLVNGSRHATIASAWLSAKADLSIVDGLVNAIATVLQSWQRSLSRFHSGATERYALVLGFGLFGLVAVFLLF